MFSALGKCGLTICSGYAFSVCIAAHGCFAQTIPGAKVRDTRLARTAQEGKKGAPPPPADSAAQPAQITLQDGRLTVNANNSDLTQILKDLSGKSGMTIQGLSKSVRIFGIYGPGNSRDVLSSLLTGSGYNFMIVGGADGSAPRELLLAPIAAAALEASSRQTDRDDPGSPGQEGAATEEQGPGAVYPVPPPVPQDENIRIEQNMRRLQHMQEQQNGPQ